MFKMSEFGNEILQLEGKSYVSYRKFDASHPLVLVGFGPNKGKEETAFYDAEYKRWNVLNGDHREGFTKAAKEGIERCRDYFLEHSEDKSMWCT
jgi:hypothetical protein